MHLPHQHACGARHGEGVQSRPNPQSAGMGRCQAQRQRGGPARMLASISAGSPQRRGPDPVSISHPRGESTGPTATSASHPVGVGHGQESAAVPMIVTSTTSALGGDSVIRR
jgi:hypothetical protein